MDSMHMAVYASVFLRKLSDGAQARSRPAERWEPGPPLGLGDVTRVAAAIGAIAAFAGVLTFAGH
jgi:hypothetical protein